MTGLVALALAVDAQRLTDIKQRVALANDCTTCGRAILSAGEGIEACGRQWGACTTDGWIVVNFRFQRMLTNDLLAFVLGHEMAHIKGYRSEREADRVGAQMAVKAGYDGAAIDTFRGLVRRGVLARVF